MRTYTVSWWSASLYDEVTGVGWTYTRTKAEKAKVNNIITWAAYGTRLAIA